jgi:PAS domain S-box-containing protein
LKANVRLKEEIRERAQTERDLRLEEARLDALLRLSQMSEDSVSQIAGFILERGIALTQSKIGFVGFLNADESVYTLHAVSRDVVRECDVAGDLVQWHIAGAGLWADAIRERKTLLVSDYSLPYPSKKGLPPGHPPVKTFMVVPIFDGNRIVAVAGVGNKASAYDKSDERQIALLLGGMWSHVLKNRSQAALKEAYDELERKVEQRTAELAAANKALQEDIIERKRTEEALRRSEKVLKLAQASARAGVWNWDIPSGKLVWSDELFRLFGLEPQKSAASFDAWRGILHPEDRVPAEKRIEAAIQNHTPLESEYRILLPSAKVRWISSLGNTTYDCDGTPRHMSGICIDITERKRAESILIRDKEAFERLVWERTRELAAAQVQLERAKRLSDIGTLAATVAHELRNPLAAISMAVYNVRRKAGTAIIDKHLRNIEKKVRESEVIINNLLFYSRIRPPHLETIDLHDIVGQCVAEAAKMTKKGIPVELKIKSLKDVPVAADPLQMTEVFTNLLNNARDAISDSRGGIEVTGSEDGESVTVVVRDSGCGIRNADLERIFDPFFTTKAKGIGLGLSVCHQIINLHDGEISIESEAGKGTTVTLRLPRKKTEDP